MTVYADLDWKRNEEGEPNEIYADYRFRTLIVYSSDDKKKWFFKLDDAEPGTLSFSTKEQAMEAAINRVEGR